MDYSNNTAKAIVAAQLGRSPRNPFRVLVEGSCGYALVIASPSVLEDGARFPNWIYLVCPRLVAAVSALESEGAIVRYFELLASDEILQNRLEQANSEFKIARHAECLQAGLEEDLCSNLNMAGQADAQKLKCLHAHVAHRLAGLDDPIGELVLQEIGEEIFAVCKLQPFCVRYDEDLRCG